MIAESISYPAAFGAGIISFFSPCILPLVPAYFTFITGYSLEELTGDTGGSVRMRVVVSTLFFVLGFSAVFVMLGASASYLGKLAFRHIDIIRVAGGILIVILGLHLTGLFRIRALEFEKRIQIQKKPLHVAGAFLVGMAFGAGWSPCVGPLLGSVLIVAGGQNTIGEGMLLLTIYAAGLAIPFILLSTFINFLLVFLKKMSRVLKYINLVAGMLLIIIGITLIFNRLMII